ncbi:DNA-dependent RNA polymerase subunit epsilon [Bacillus suaedaesalsae]|uniref:DNA-directed RNA polymerase subunit epsilon n=1 Tax=Bacillus suaedaesalsae TaxID=2810349 RepID=A0ABS2DJD3_9BACI|nr:DNA-directed RNA polymerase subunit epsilon [Bacillus suaedaesalsae]MBM6617608.1 DNA-dependent RNA polymerase auxiliary subunit epsilon family protein [Bacillus suaedaesalsae]
MIFKVFFQEDIFQAPVREHTKTMYVEADNEGDVRTKLAERPYNIEFIQSVTGAYLDYEKQSENYKLETV